MKEVKLQFMVVPSELENYARVPNPVKVRVVDLEGMSQVGLFGESGKRLAHAGALFYFEESLAKSLIEKEIVEKVL